MSFKVFIKEFLSLFKTDSVILGIPGLTIIAVAAILTITLLFRRLFSLVVIKYFQTLARKTKTELDDTLIQVLEKPLNSLIILLGFIASRMLLLSYINPNLDNTLQSLLQFSLVIILCWFFYSSADIISGFL